MHSNWPTSVTSGELGITVCLYHLAVSLMSVTSVCDAVGGHGLECPLEGQGSESRHTVSDTPEWSLKPPHTRASGHLCPIYTATCERERNHNIYVLKHNHIKAYQAGMRPCFKSFVLARYHLKHTLCLVTLHIIFVSDMRCPGMQTHHG